jgi:hypothetical protein
MAQRLTFDTWAASARVTHGNKYDYSKAQAQWQGVKSLLTITCPVHGDFKQNAGEHRYGKGCRACGLQKFATSRSLSLDEVIAAWKRTHGERYDYSKVVYTSWDCIVTIVCPVHGDFEQNARDHTASKGCRKCAGFDVPLADRLKQARKAHGGRYDYSKVTALTLNETVTVGCPAHGDFDIQWGAHLQGTGCRKCAGKGLTLEDKLARGREMHGDLYDYSRVTSCLITSTDEIVCRTHGPFHQVWDHHARGSGCPACARIAIGEAAKERFDRDPSGFPSLTYRRKRYTWGHETLLLQGFEPQALDYLRSLGLTRKQVQVSTRYVPP